MNIGRSPHGGSGDVKGRVWALRTSWAVGLAAAFGCGCGCGTAGPRGDAGRDGADGALDGSVEPRDATDDARDGAPEAGVREAVITEEPEVLLSGLDAELLAGAFGVAGDPTFARLGERWWMFFTSLRLDDAPAPRIYVLAAHTAGGLGAPREDWTILTHPTTGEILPVLAPGEAGAWDEGGVEVPRYVEGFDGDRPVTRLYYTGYRALGVLPYEVGFAEWDEALGTWRKHPDAVLVGTEAWERYGGVGFVGEPAVEYVAGPGAGGAGGRWHLWYTAHSDLVASGLSVVGHAESDDGVAWGVHERLVHAGPYPSEAVPSGPYHLDVHALDGRWVFVGFAPSVPPAGRLERQGHWLTWSASPTGGGEGDFAVWVPLLYEATWFAALGEADVGRDCHQTGFFPATLVEDGAELYYFFHYVIDTEPASPPCGGDAGGQIGSIARARVVERPWSE